MRDRLWILVAALAASITNAGGVRAQSGPPSAATQTQTSAHIPDLSGDWLPDPPGCGWNPADPQCQKLEDGTPYQPWALEKLKSERSGYGENATFENTTDPYMKYCDPYGNPREFFNPTKFKFIQTPDTVYILNEMGPFWQQVALNRKTHPQDPDPQWWGDSIGWYERDTFVVDTVGFNDRTWLDQVGRPHTEALHLIERFRRVDQEHLELDITVDDPKAYTKSWVGKKVFKATHTGLGRYLWVCDMRANQRFDTEFEKPTTIPATPPRK
jgi:hypothetical protein